MVECGISDCPKCGGYLKPYDSVPRIKKDKYQETTWLSIRRLRCVQCGSLHRELPDSLLPNKHYDSEIIFGVVDGFITCETLGFEDYPCEATMCRWCAEFTIPIMRN